VSCHPGSGRADGLNWDLLNDGMGRTSEPTKEQIADLAEFVLTR
jgi:hypothetical protein